MKRVKVFAPASMKAEKQNSNFVGFAVAGLGDLFEIEEQEERHIKIEADSESYNRDWCETVFSQKQKPSVLIQGISPLHSPKRIPVEMTEKCCDIVISTAAEKSLSFADSIQEQIEVILASAAKLILDSSGDNLLLRNLASRFQNNVNQNRAGCSPDHFAGLNVAGEAALWSGAEAQIICPNGSAVVAFCQDSFHADYLAKVMKWALQRRNICSEPFVAEVEFAEE